MLELTDQNFESEVLSSDVPVLVDFWAPWCGPCKRMLPIVEELAEELKDARVKIAKMNADENSETPMKYNIMSIPTFILFDKGEIKLTLQGAQEKQALKNALGLK